MSRESLSASGDVRPRVLVVDDDPAMVDLLRRFLTLKGYAVGTAYAGPEAIQKVKGDRPHVVLLDINMPRMNGLEVLRRIREFAPEVGAIVVSGISDEDTSRAARALGALDYLTKPVSFRSLEQTLARRISPMDP